MLSDDERLFASYLAARVTLTYVEAHKLRATLASRYGFKDPWLSYLSREVLRRASIRNDPVPLGVPAELSVEQKALVTRCVAFLSPSSDLGEERERPPSRATAIRIPKVRDEPPTLCPHCLSSTGSSKTSFSSKEQALQKVEYVKRVYGGIQEPYQCPVGNGWHLRTVMFATRQTHGVPAIPLKVLGRTGPVQSSPPQPAARPGGISPLPTAAVVSRFTPDQAQARRYRLSIESLALAQPAQASAGTEDRLRSHLRSLLGTNSYMTDYEWLHIDSVDTIIHVAGNLAYGSTSFSLTLEAVLIELPSGQLRIGNRDVSWR